MRSKWFSLKTFFPWLLMRLTSYLLIDNFRFFIRIPCLSLWARFTFNSFMKTRTDLIVRDLWLLRILSKISVLYWNRKSVFFSSNLPFRIFTSTWYFFSFYRYHFSIISSTFLSSSTCCFNLRISFSCSSNAWSSSSFFLFDFSRSSFTEMTSASRPS